MREIENFAPELAPLCLSRMVGGSRYGETCMQSICLWDTDLRSANLIGANLRDGLLVDVDLRGAHLRGADLREADLCGADLTGADFRGANLTDTTVLDSVNMHTVRLTKAVMYNIPITPLAQALVRVRAPWECVSWFWIMEEALKRELEGVPPNPEGYDYWAGLAKLHMLGQGDE